MRAYVLELTDSNKNKILQDKYIFNQLKKASLI